MRPCENTRLRMTVWLPSSSEASRLILVLTSHLSA
jgi:hypothetical protein